MALSLTKDEVMERLNARSSDFERELVERWKTFTADRPVGKEDFLLHLPAIVAAAVLDIAFGESQERSDSPPGEA